MREVHVSLLTAAVAEMCREANYYLGADIISALQKGLEEEISPAGKAVFRELLENARIAGEEKIPICQDTGFAVLFVEMGQELHFVGGDFNEAIHEGVRQGYLDGFLRKSIVKDPLRRENTGDNTPAVIHLEIVPGDKLKLIFVPKGGGSENMSAVKMLTPSLGKEGLVDFVEETVAGAGASACPPMVVGVGLGGTLEKVTYLAKKALLRPLGQPHHDPFYAGLEMELLEKINRTGIGPQGFGGRFTALAVHIEAFPCHIASMPAAVNINCHASRHVERII
ncbi:MAG TPA: fumarate hydratase [Firmicutes bacterium]|nr:fumarate hydratase [Bacillota bacterium]